MNENLKESVGLPNGSLTAEATTEPHSQGIEVRYNSKHRNENKVCVKIVWDGIKEQLMLRYRSARCSEDSLWDGIVPLTPPAYLSRTESMLLNAGVDKADAHDLTISIARLFTKADPEPEVCPYCHGHKKFMVSKNGMTAAIFGTNLVVSDNPEDPIPILFCPMCGRRLVSSEFIPEKEYLPEPKSAPEPCADDKPFGNHEIMDPNPVPEYPSGCRTREAPKPPNEEWEPECSIH